MAVASLNNKQRALRKVGDLPAFSPVLNKLIATLADDSVSFVEIATLIERDSVLAGNVMRIVNSALYGRRGNISSIRHAVSLMGLNKLRNTAMSLSLCRMWNAVKAPPWWSAAQFNLHAVASALWADLLIEEFSVDYAEGAFVAGLLHDIGMLLFVTALPEDYTLVRRLYEMSDYTLEDCELQVTGIEHGELSGAVLQRWNLPLPIQEAVRRHNIPPRNAQGPTGLAELISLAEHLAVQSGNPVQSWLRQSGESPADVLSSRMPAERIEHLWQHFQEEFDLLRSGM